MSKESNSKKWPDQSGTIKFMIEIALSLLRLVLLKRVALSGGKKIENSRVNLALCSSSMRFKSCLVIKWLARKELVDPISVAKRACQVVAQARDNSH